MIPISVVHMSPDWPCTLQGKKRDWDRIVAALPAVDAPTAPVKLRRPTPLPANETITQIIDRHVAGKGANEVVRVSMPYELALAVLEAARV